MCVEIINDRLLVNKMAFTDRIVQGTKGKFLHKVSRVKCVLRI